MPTKNNRTLDDTQDLKFELLNKRLNSIEKKYELDKASFFTKFSRWAGILALVISMFVGAFEIHDKTFGKLLETEQAELEKVSNGIEKLSRYTQELSTLWANGKIFEFNLRVQQVNLERSKILAEFEKIDSDIRSKLDPIKLIAIGVEYKNLNDIINASSYFSNALENSDSILIEIEGRRLLADSLSYPSKVLDKEKSQRLIQEAYEMLSDSEDIRSIGLKQGVLNNWISIEARLGDCIKSRKLIDQLTKFLKVNNFTTPDADEIAFKKTFDTTAPCK